MPETVKKIVVGAYIDSLTYTYGLVNHPYPTAHTDNVWQPFR